MADYDIFREQLAIKYPLYGHALWEPNPKDPDKPVQVGDVGFIRSGKFHRLFNALLPADDPSHKHGVPEYYEKLVPKLKEDHLDKGSLARSHYCSPGVGVEPDSRLELGPDDIPQVKFQYDKTRGAAVLSLPVTAQREDTLSLGDFKLWIVKHIDRCFAFARNLNLGIERMEEIILVTGCDRTKSWANIAFLGNEAVTVGNHASSQVSFGVRVEGKDPRITFQFLPENVQGAVLRHGPEGKSLPENQCVFIRGYRVSRSFWILPKRLKAAAGPSPDTEGYDCDPDMEVISMPATTKYRDPLYLLLDYIAEQASDCDMVLAHDDDLVKIDGLGHDSSLETLEPDVMIDLLRRSNIKIHQVPCVSATDSGPNTDTSVVKVAMLSMKSQNLDIEPQCQESPVAEDVNIDISRASELRVPGSFPVPTTGGHTSALPTSLPAEHGDGVPSTLQDLIIFKHATEHIVLALRKIRNELSNIWSSLSKFAHVERNTLTTTVVIIGCAVSLLGWVFSFTWGVIFKLFFTLLLASLPLCQLFEREYRHRLRLDERLEHLHRCVVSLQSNTAVPTRLDNNWISYPITAGKETPANQGRLERSTQDIVEPVIPGPSTHREYQVETASPYHIEAHEENTSDTMERSSQQAAPHSFVKHSDSGTDASVASQSSTGPVAANTTTDEDPRFAFKNVSKSSASTGGERRRGDGGDDGGESGDDSHEREREWEREWERELARRAGE